MTLRRDNLRAQPHRYPRAFLFCTAKHSILYKYATSFICEPNQELESGSMKSSAALENLPQIWEIFQRLS